MGWDDDKQKNDSAFSSLTFNLLLEQFVFSVFFVVCFFTFNIRIMEVRTWKRGMVELILEKAVFKFILVWLITDYNS